MVNVGVVMNFYSAANSVLDGTIKASMTDERLVIFLEFLSFLFKSKYLFIFSIKKINA